MLFTGLSDIDWPNRVWVTGTGTNVGKTIFAAWLVKRLMAVYWKPIQAGIHPLTDTERVAKITGLSADHILPERYILKEPLSPHEAARRESINMRLDDFQMPKIPNTLIIEGAGGICVPINHRHLMLDLIKKLSAPVIVVARSELGTINHTLLTIDRLTREGIEVLGVVMNGKSHPHNKEAIEYYANVNVLMEFPHLENIERDIQNLK